MERIKNVMQRLQELYYSKHQKTSIDVDLMLDYTRVMYADLLAWRKDFKDEPQTAEPAEKNEAVVIREAKAAAPTHPDERGKGEQPTKEASPVKTGQTEGPKEENQPEPKVQREQPEATEKIPAAAAEHEDLNHPGFFPIDRDEPAPRKPMMATQAETIVKETPEAEHIDVLQSDASGITFEPPTPADVIKEIKEEIAVEEPTTKAEVAETPAPPAASIPLPNMDIADKPKPFIPPSTQQFTVPAQRKDIRSSIGINDKYLFLNELFNNHKSNYEEALDKLNLLNNYDEGLDWVKTKVVPLHKWDKEDATVISFYAMLGKHFSAK